MRDRGGVNELLQEWNENNKYTEQCNNNENKMRKIRRKWNGKRIGGKNWLMCYAISKIIVFGVWNNWVIL